MSRAPLVGMPWQQLVLLASRGLQPANGCDCTSMNAIAAFIWGLLYGKGRALERFCCIQCKLCSECLTSVS